MSPGEFITTGRDGIGQLRRHALDLVQVALGDGTVLAEVYAAMIAGDIAEGTVTTVGADTALIIAMRHLLEEADHGQLSHVHLISLTNVLAASLLVRCSRLVSRS